MTRTSGGATCGTVFSVVDGPLLYQWWSDPTGLIGAPACVIAPERSPAGAGFRGDLAALDGGGAA